MLDLSRDEKAKHFLPRWLRDAHDERMADIMERRKKERDRKRRNRAVSQVKDELGAVYADVLKAWLNGQTWSDIGVPERTCWDRPVSGESFSSGHGRKWTKYGLLTDELRTKYGRDTDLKTDGKWTAVTRDA